MDGPGIFGKNTDVNQAIRKLSWYHSEPAPRFQSEVKEDRMHSKSFLVMFVAGLIAMGALLPAAAQEEAAPKADAQPAAQPAQQPWATQCSATSRKAPLNCTMEQQVVVRETGRPIARISIQVGAAEPRKPAVLLHVPLSLSIGAGITMQIDEAEPLKFDVQTCDANGCYAGSPMTDEMIASLKRGQTLKVGFQGVNREPVSIPFSLAGFTASFENVQ
jgi:invasion protein IalB